MITIWLTLLHKSWRNHTLTLVAAWHKIKKDDNTVATFTFTQIMYNRIDACMTANLINICRQAYFLDIIDAKVTKNGLEHQNVY